jgi:hypothetical protein
MIYTFVVLGLYFIIAFLPKVPWYAKLVLQIILGAVIYMGFPEAEFVLPMGDSLPFSSLLGGNPEWMGLPFNKYAMGVLGTVLGILGTVFATILYAIFGKKSEGDGSSKE